MKTLLPLLFAAACAPVWAQTPSANILPDGSTDMYVGLGAQSAPRYEGAAARRIEAAPAIQIQWSNGLFVSGLSAGWHLGSEPGIEFGPLVAFDPGRNASGTGRFQVLPAITGSGGQGSILPPGAAGTATVKLADLPDVDARLMGGGFFNYAVTGDFRLLSEVLYGAGNDHNGARLSLNLQKNWPALASHHTLSITAGATWINGAYARAYFSVPAKALDNGSLVGYTAAGGLKDVHLAAHWNWALNNSWLLASNLTLARLQGDAAASPLSDRRSSLSLSTALAYRF